MAVVLVLGASGAVGRFLLPRLVAAGDDVLAVSRTPRTSASARLHWLQGDLGHALPALPPLDVLYSCGPLDAFAHWYARAPLQARRIVAIGSMSIDSKQASTDAHERALAARLRDAERTLAATADARGGAWTVLRPTLIYGAGVDQSLTPLVHRARRWRIFPRIAGARGLRQPVHADDLAAACVAVAARARCAGRPYAVGGGERLAFATMLERVRASLPFRTVPVPLPLRALRGVLAMTGRAGLSPALVDRLGVDLVADLGDAQADFDFAPRPFRPDATCWDATASFRQD
ncbi:NAD-dependent epimerase/dehydratase family protein [Dokdonella sp.]|uniref:NAD-dependent epimerase/dehydratase family protein n=1 Tax=Dokdonella sp. TaxID=2291710 RepID=UPI002F3E3D52